MQQPILAIVGATATGKSALALALAEELGGEIVSADSLQAYRGLDLGTAKPGAADRARVPHHLVDILEPDEVYSAGEFARRARAAIVEIAARGRMPIVVGGSGLYLRALLRGLSPLPPGDPEVRAALRSRLENEGLAGAARRAAADRPQDGGAADRGGHPAGAARARSGMRHRAPALRLARRATLWDSSHCGGTDRIDAPA